MAIDFRCLCGRALSLRDDLAGKLIKCPGCGATLRVPLRRITEPAESQVPMLIEEFIDEAPPPSANPPPMPQPASTAVPPPLPAAEVIAPNDPLPESRAEPPPESRAEGRGRRRRRRRGKRLVVPGIEPDGDDGNWLTSDMSIVVGPLMLISGIIFLLIFLSIGVLVFFAVALIVSGAAMTLRSLMDLY